MKIAMALLRKTSELALGIAILLIVFSPFLGKNLAGAQTTGAALNRPNSVVVSGNYAYVTSTNSNALEILDISDPTLPLHKGLIASGDGGATIFAPTSVAVSGSYAYVTSPLANAIEIVDISDPANPTHANTLFHGDNGVQLGRPQFITIYGNYAYVLVSGSQIIEILDITDPINPVPSGGRYSAGSLAVPTTLFVSGNYMYVGFSCLCNGSGTVNIVDISNPTHPIQVNGINNSDTSQISFPASVFVSGNYAYISWWGTYSFQIVDVSDPTNPVDKSGLADGEGGAVLFTPGRIFVNNNYAYIPSQNNDTLEILDVSNPTSPIHKGKWVSDELNSYPNSVQVAGNYAYVTLSLGNALGIIDISDPTNPVLASKIKDGELVGTPPPPPVGCTIDCFSNVLFLPGLMGSRLYDSTENELWVSSDDSAHSELALDNQGKSINNTIHTKDDTQNNGELDETGIVDDVYNFNTYQSFIADLRKWKDNDKIIEDYAFIPYDWRLSLEDIITDGSTNNGNLSYTTSQNFSDSFILKKLEELQASSRTGKVTIIAHSNGGLVVKALVQKLNDTNNPLYDKIDKIILVAVPQIGTPDALAALLHGTELGHGFIMDKDRSRQLSENMPGVYNLLPSASYFTTVDPAFAVDKLVSFENTSFFDPQTSQYGVFVSNETELENYVLGTDGRTKPAFSDTVNPNIGNSALYDQAESTHQILDVWQPSPSTKVIQVAGWGEETLAGIDYISIIDTTEHLSYKPRWVVDGDGTVVVPSALWMSTTPPNVERWWVDLEEFNEDAVIFRTLHRDILEIPNLLDFLKSRIRDVSYTDSEEIIVNNTSTLVADGERLHYTLHSPLTLGIIDAQGKYTGQDPVTREIKEEIPGVTYKQIGEVQFLSVPADLTHTLKLDGFKDGHFALDVEKQQGNTITEFTSFEGIPSSASTLVTMDFTPDMAIADTILELDQDGDGEAEKTLEATPEGTTVYDDTSPELYVTFDILTKDVIFSAKDNIDPNPTLIATNTTVTLKDSSGNTTVIPFKRLRENPTRFRFTYNQIIRNGAITVLPNTNIIYDWKEKQGILTDLDTRVVIKGVEKYVFNYKKANNVTIIKEKKGNGVVTITKPGFVAVKVQTEGDTLKVDY